jgi:predicted phosphoribosyltransferase
VHYADFRQVADEEVIAALARVGGGANPAPQADAGASGTA